MKTPFLTLLALGLLAAFGLSGCGGGGGGGSSSPSAGSSGTNTSSTASAATVNGLLQTSSGSALGGYAVVYDAGIVTDANATLTTTTGASGTYSLTIPARDITGSDKLTFYDPLGGAAATQSVSLTPGQPLSVTTTASTGTAPPVP